VPGGGPQEMTSPVAYWHVPDLEAKLAEVTAAGATVKEPAPDPALLAPWTSHATCDTDGDGCVGDANGTAFASRAGFY